MHLEDGHRTLPINLQGDSFSLAPMVSYITMISQTADITSGCQIAVISRYQELRDYIVMKSYWGEINL